MDFDQIRENVLSKCEDIAIELPKEDSEEIGLLGGAFVAKEFAVISAIAPDLAVAMIAETLRYAYSLGYRRGKASSIQFVVADETP